MPDIEIVSEASNGMHALSEIQKTQPDLIITDLSMPGLDGFELIELVANKFPQIKILVLTMHGERAYVQKAIDLGISGYLLKDVSIDELIDAINAVLEGDFYFCKKVTKVIMHKMTQSNHLVGSANAIFQLTAREKEILKLIVDGLNSASVGKKLSISARTVQNHRAHIIKKTGVKNTAELVKLVLENRLF